MCYTGFRVREGESPSGSFALAKVLGMVSSLPVSSPDELRRADAAAAAILARTALRPRIAVVLGSGLGSFAEQLNGTAVIAYGDIPFFPLSTAIGHAGRFVV